MSTIDFRSPYFNFNISNSVRCRLDFFLIFFFSFCWATRLVEFDWKCKKRLMASENCQAHELSNSLQYFKYIYNPRHSLPISLCICRYIPSIYRQRAKQNKMRDRQTQTQKYILGIVRMYLYLQFGCSAINKIQRYK